MGEFGVGYPCFLDDKGGLQFVRDMVDINKANDIHFTYHVYHEDNFGLYLGGALPDPGNTNQPLIDLFTDILN
jgi:endoglucanase